MSAEPKATDPTGDEINIRNVLKGFAEAWNRHDAEALSRLISLDGTCHSLFSWGILVPSVTDDHPLPVLALKESGEFPRTQRCT